ncbi:MAG: YbfB/YjiJ family MFS transporter [Nocardioidaceae bacterium]
MDTMTLPESTHAEHRQSRTVERQLTVGGLLAIGVSFGFARYGYGLFLPEIRREFALSVSTVGLIGSATYAGYLLALTIVAVAATRLGPRLLVAVGGASAVVGMALVAFAPGPGLLAAGLVLAGTSPGWAWAPYSDAVDLVVAPARRERVLAVIPAGTAVGTAVVGPLALLADGAWRSAWFAMAVVAAGVTVYNARVLPRRGRTAANRPEPTRQGGLGWFGQRAALPLYVTALSYGVLGAFYWYFATEALTRASLSAATTTAVFWTVMGVAGIAGVFAGALLSRLGLRTSSRLLFAALATAVALLGIAPGSFVASAASAVLYGPAFMAVSSLLAVWSYQVFPERPTRGFSATLLCLGVGTVIGPAALGAVAQHSDLRTAFLTAAAIALATVFVKAPRRAVSRASGRTCVPALAAAARPTVTT